MIKGIIKLLTITQYNLALKANNHIMKTNYSIDGRMQEKGQQLEQKIKDILSLCDHIEVVASKLNSALDNILKIDILFYCKSMNQYYGFQVKSNVKDTDDFLEQYSKGIKYKGQWYDCPWVFYPDNQSNSEILDELCEHLDLSIDDIDWDKLEAIVIKVVSSNGKRRPISDFEKLTVKEIKALRLLYNVSKNKNTYFIK